METSMIWRRAPIGVGSNPNNIIRSSAFSIASLPTDDQHVKGVLVVFVAPLQENGVGLLKESYPT